MIESVKRRFHELRTRSCPSETVELVLDGVTTGDVALEHAARSTGGPAWERIRFLSQAVCAPVKRRRPRAGYEGSAVRSG
jgi:hypothetical protein